MLSVGKDYGSIDYGYVRKCCYYLRYFMWLSMMCRRALGRDCSLSLLPSFFAFLASFFFLLLGI